MNRIKKFSYLGILIFMTIIFMAGQASALSFIDFIRPAGPDEASDQNREYLIDRVQPGGEIGQLDVGDSFRGLININTINSGAANLGGTSGNDELTAVFQVAITAKIAGGDVFNNTTGVVGSDGIPDTYTFLFGPDPDFALDINGGIGAPKLFVPGAGAIAVIFSDPASNFAGDFDDGPAFGGTGAAPPADTDIDLTNGPFDDGTVGPRTTPPSSADVSSGSYATEEAFIGTAIDGTWVTTIGMLGLPGEMANGSTVFIPGGTFDNVLSAFLAGSGTIGATSNFFLNVIAQNVTDYPLLVFDRAIPGVGGNLVDFSLAQSIKGVSNLDTPFEVSTNTDIVFDARVVPEPASMLLFGSGLLGLAGFSRRRMKKRS